MTTKTFIISQPTIRDDIIDSLQDLANKEWYKTKPDGQYYFTVYFDYLLYCVYHTLYDDNELHEKEYALKNIGRIFYNEEEALAVYEFCYWFHDFSGDIGEDEPNEAYLENPQWHKVWSGAEELIKLMEENNKKYDIQASWDFWECNTGKPGYLELIKKENAKYAQAAQKEE